MAERRGNQTRGNEVMKRLHHLKDRKDDLYETHPVATRTFLKHHADKIPDMVWECCAGRGAIVREIRQTGRTVIATDLNDHDGADEGIETAIDFFFELQPRASMIITNPPYKLANDFIRHALNLNCSFAGLMPLTYLSGANRSDILRRCSACYAFIERLPMMHREGWIGKKIESSAIPFAWFVFEPDFESDTINLKRVSWRNA